MYDKVRAQWRYGKSAAVEPMELPSAEETLQQRIERSFCNEYNASGMVPPTEQSSEERMERSLGNDDNSSDIIPPTVRSSVRNVFGESELDNIRRLFKDMIGKSVSISKVTVRKMLEKEEWGRVLLSKVPLETVLYCM